MTGDRGHQIGVGDVVITRRNDPTIEVYQPQDRTQKLSGAPVRNGQRWRVVKVDDSLEQPRIAARRLGDGAWAVFDRDYLREHVQLGHAVTVHAAQGVTAERTHAVLADTASRNLAYVALTRGRASNHAYLYQRDSAEAGHTHSHNLAGAKGVHLARRGTPTQAARALRQVIGRDEPPPHRTPDRRRHSRPVPARAGRRTRRRAPAHGHPTPQHLPENPTRTTRSGTRPTPWPRPQPQPRTGLRL